MNSDANEELAKVMTDLESELGCSLVAYLEEEDDVAYGLNLIEELEVRDESGVTVLRTGAPLKLDERQVEILKEVERRFYVGLVGYHRASDSVVFGEGLVEALDETYSGDD